MNKNKLFYDAAMSLLITSDAINYLEDHQSLLLDMLLDRGVSYRDAEAVLLSSGRDEMERFEKYLCCIEKNELENEFEKWLESGDMEMMVQDLRQNLSLDQFNLFLC